MDWTSGDIRPVKTDNPIKLAIDATLRKAQFQRKANTWYKELDETTLVVNVQKSSFGEQYYINLGILVKGFLASRNDIVPPKETDCHIRLRVESLNPDEDEPLKQALNLENHSISPAERQERVGKLITDVALPFLLRCSTHAGIRAMYRQGGLDRALVQKSIRSTVLS